MRFSQKREFSPYALSALRRYCVALLCTAVAAAGVAACVWWFSLSTFLFFVVAIAAAQAYGGMGSGIVSASVALGLSLYAFLPPHLSWETERSPWPLAGIYYLAVLVCYLITNRARWNIGHRRMPENRISGPTPPGGAARHPW